MFPGLKKFQYSSIIKTKQPTFPSSKYLRLIFLLDALSFTVGMPSFGKMHSVSKNALFVTVLPALRTPETQISTNKTPKLWHKIYDRDGFQPVKTYIHTNIHTCVQSYIT